MGKDQIWRRRVLGYRLLNTRDQKRLSLPRPHEHLPNGAGGAHRRGCAKNKSEVHPDPLGFFDKVDELLMWEATTVGWPS